MPILDFAEKLAADKPVLGDIIEIFQAFYRDVLLTLQGRPVEEIVNRDLTAKISRACERESIPSLLAKLEALADLRRQLDRNVNNQLAMEVLLLKLAA